MTLVILPSGEVLLPSEDPRF